MTITYVFEQNLYLNITNRCANACVFCLRGSTDTVGDSNTLWLEREPTVDEILADIFTRDLTKYKSLVFCGFGEPLERLDDVIFIAKNIKERSNIEIRLNTNGLADLMYGFNVPPRLKGVIDVISISLNAPTPEEYNKICQSSFGLKALPAVLKFANECTRHIDKVILSVVDTIGAEKIEQCKKLCEEANAIFRVRSYIE